jgi:hypothetical protein
VNLLRAEKLDTLAPSTDWGLPLCFGAAGSARFGKTQQDLLKQRWSSVEKSTADAEGDW